MTIRITGGIARGRPIRSPAGRKARPTASKMRQALFNILGSRISQAKFLDIFAGTGLIGLEALSRGAASLTAIEQSKPLAASIKMAAQQLGYEAEVLVVDFRRTLPNLVGRKFDIVFADPPYDAGFEESVLALVTGSNSLDENGILIIEHSNKKQIACHDQSLQEIDRRQYGQSAFSFYAKR